jgi:hypothetical protein
MQPGLVRRRAGLVDEPILRETGLEVGVAKMLGKSFSCDLLKGSPMAQQNVIATVMLVLITSAGHAADSARQFSCAGTMIEPDATSQSDKSLRLTLGPGQKIGLNLGQGNVSTHQVSDNRIQLKFRTNDFTGEFFHYTNEMFLIYKSGHLARLACTPN